MTLLALGKWGQTTSAKVCNAFVYTEEGLEDFVYDSNIQIINIFSTVYSKISFSIKSILVVFCRL